MRRCSASAPRRQKGAAILLAMLTVVLVATMASAVLWQQWREIEVESAERLRAQSSWILTGALDWARLILREDAKQGGADHLGELWAVPLAPARLSAFLAFDNNDASTAQAVKDAFLSGQITDLQSRLNLFNLVQGGKIHEPTRMVLSKLFARLGLPRDALVRLADNLLAAQQMQVADVATSKAPLLPQSLDQLGWLGLSQQAITLLQPYITLLPVPTPVNLNTAPVEVVYACIDGFDMADATRFVNARTNAPWKLFSDAQKAAGSVPLNETQHTIKSNFFEVRGVFEVGSVRVQEQSMVQRKGLQMKTLTRQRVVLPGLLAGLPIDPAPEKRAP